ncbi:MAG: N-acetylmuramoyl-L-alanine amidase [Succinivibrionaceae bacterium]|nr:N-acetylmuramoyl-L-alanine amidase [Succinivibrionaceae bacterium]
MECASDFSEPYAMKPEVYSALIELCVDICRRNGKKRLVWIADREKALRYEVKENEMLLTVHRWFARKSCPGNWLMERLSSFADDVNGKLGI